MLTDAVDFNYGLPAAALRHFYAGETARVIRAKAGITPIDLVADLPQVHEPVISRITVDVVNHAGRQLTVNNGPDDAVRCGGHTKNGPR